MDFYESPLLNYPSLMLTVLKTAARGRATIEDCVANLRTRLAEAGEQPAVSMREVADHLETCKSQLLTANLLEPAGNRQFRLTARGCDVLAANPMGVDDTVLMQFPEFRQHLLQVQEHPPPDDPHIQEYDQGALAFRKGHDLSANPYEPDTIMHQAWENGWNGARDSRADW